MGQLTWKAWMLVVGAGTVVALVVFVSLQVYKHLWIDHAAYHQQVIPLLNYNLQQGRLVALPTTPVPAPVTPAPSPSPEPPKQE